MKQLVKILDDAQKGEAEHLKGLKSINKLYHKNEEQFKTEFIPILQRLLVTAQNDASVDRLITFISKFTSNQDENDDLIDFMVGYLVETTQVIDKTVRLRSCQIISSIMSNLPAETEISDETWQRISKRIVPRLRDKLPQIRMEAVKALNRLQDPFSEDDTVIEGYVKLLASDSNKDVRKIVLKNMSPSPITIPHFIKRTRDNNSDVRALVYKILTSVDLKLLDIDQRIAMLRNGLGDREATVKNACVTMICSGWLKRQGDDLVKLLGYLLVERFEDIAEKVIKLVLRNCEISWTPPKVAKRNSLPILTPESTLLWKIHLYWLKKRLQKEPSVQDQLDRATPAVPQFCALLKAYASNEFIAKHLVGMVEYLDLSDEAGRRELSDVLRKLLPSPRIAEALKKSIMKTLKLLHDDEDYYITVILEIISEIQDPLEASQVLSQEDFDSSQPSTPSTPTTPASKRSMVRGPSAFNLRSSSLNLRGSPESPAPLRRALTSSGSVTPRGADDHPQEDWLSYSASDKLADLQALRSTFAKKNDTHALQRIDKEIAILKDKCDDDKLTPEERRWVHCMAITEELLQLTTKDLQNPGIHDLLSNVILRYVTHKMPRIRERAMRCLGLFCMLSKDVARAYLHLFSQALQNDQLQIQCVVLKLLFDLLLVYGMDGFEEIESSQTQGPDSQSLRKIGDNHSVIVSMLCGFLLHESAELRAIVVEGFCKLMYSDQICDPKILSNLVVLFFLHEPPEQPVESPQPKKPNRKGEVDIPVDLAISSPYAHIRQCLSVFLPAYSFQSLDHMQSILSAFIPTIREITHNMGKYLHGPNDNVQVVQVTRVAQLFVHLTTTNTTEGVSCPHNELAIKLVKEILADSEDPASLTLCKVFKDLQLSRHSPSIKTLKFFTSLLLEKLKKETSVRKVLTKFLDELQALDPVPDVEPTPTVLANLKEELTIHTEQLQDYVRSKKVLFSPPKKRTRRQSISEVSDEECEEGERKISPVVKRDTPGRESKKRATSKIGELAASMKSLKHVLANLDKSSDEDEEEEEDEDSAGRSRQKRSPSKGNRKSKSKARTEEEEEEGEEDNSDEADDEGEQEEDEEDIEDSDIEEPNSKRNRQRRGKAELDAPDLRRNKASSKKTKKNDESEDSADEPPKKKQMRRKGRRSDESDSDNKKVDIKKRKRGSKESESDTGSSSTESPKKLRATRKSKKAQQPASDESEEQASDSEEEEKRVTRQRGKAPSPSKTAKSTKQNGRKKQEESDDEVIVTGSNSPKRVTRSSTKTAKEEEEVAEEINSDEEEEEDDSRVTRSRKSSRKEKEKAQEKKKPKKNGKANESNSDSEDEEEDVNDEDEDEENGNDGEGDEDEDEDESEIEREKTRRAETKKNTLFNSQSLSFSPVRSVVVAFGEDLAKGEVTKLTSMVEKLNGRVYSSSAIYSPDITHVVEGKQPTTKMLFAIVTNRWLVSPKWIKDSALQGAFLSETDYGVKCTNPILKKTVYIDAALKESDRRRVELIKSLLKLGRATVVEDQSKADIVLVGQKANEKGKRGKGKGKGEEGEGSVYEWDEFVCYLRDNR